MKSQEIKSQNFEALSTYLDQNIVDKKTPGVQFIVADTTGVLFEYNKGQSNIQNATPVVPETQFKMYSVTKIITMISVMQLIEQGLIDLEASISNYLDMSFSKDITVRMVLSHTAGFNRNPFFKELHLEEEDSDFNYSDFIKYALPKYNKTIYKPGAKNVYSNYGFLVLSAVVEKVSGLSYEDYVQQNITSKLNLDTNDYLGFKYTNQTATGYQKRRTLMHWLYSLLIDSKKYYGPKNKNWQSLNNLYMKGLGFGGGFANARGLAKLMSALLQYQLVSEATLNTTFKPQSYGNTKTANQTLGWWHGIVAQQQSYYHPGGGGGYSCEVRVYPEKGVIRIMMMNSTQSFSDLKMFSQIDKLWLPD